MTRRARACESIGDIGKGSGGDKSA